MGKHKKTNEKHGLRLKFYEQTRTPNGIMYGVTMDQFGRIMRQNEKGEAVPTGSVGSANH